MSFPIAVTIAGSDSGGGAGIQADLKAFAALGVYGASALTAITAQNSQGVAAAQGLPLDLVAAQIDAIFSDLPVGAVKTGMLASAPLVELVAERLAKWRPPHVVVDPVMYAKDGTALLDPQGMAAVMRHLLPPATVVTPNTPEAAAMTGVEVVDERTAEQACRALAQLGPRHVLLKAGHLPGDPVDLLWDGERLHRLPYPRVAGAPVHGTGCTLSAAIAAELARGLPPVEAITAARAWLQVQIERAQVLGKGFRLFVPPA